MWGDTTVCASPSEMTLRRTYTDHALQADNDRFWTVLYQGVSVGTIVQHQGTPGLPETWRWTVHLQAGRFGNGVRQATATEGSEPSRDATLAPVRAAFQRYLEHVGPDGWARHVEHMEWLSIRRGAWVSEEPGQDRQHDDLPSR